MEGYDLLNRLTETDKIRDVKVLGTVVDVVDFRSFLKSSVKVGDGVKFVELKTHAIYVDGSWKLMDGVIYSTVSEEWVSGELGDLIVCSGTLSTVNLVASKEVSMFKFTKRGDEWNILAVDVKRALPNMFDGTILKQAFGFLKQFPLTGKINDFGYQKAITNKFKSAYNIDLHEEIPHTKECEFIKLEGVRSFEPVQQQVLSEMLVIPAFQLKLNYEANEISDILQNIRDQRDGQVLIYNFINVKCDWEYLHNIYKRVSSDPEHEGKPVIFLVNYKREGIPYLELGRRVLL